MAKLVWDDAGNRKYETGIEHCALYQYDKTKAGNSTSEYGTGVAWNGITSVSESPDGAEANDLWADDMKYATIRSTENFGGSIEAYTYPDEFGECDGTVNVGGVIVGMQPRKTLGLAYITQVGSDTLSLSDETEASEMLHIIYNATVSPSERSYETINDSPDAITFSWEFETTPINTNDSRVPKPISSIRIDTTRFEEDVDEGEGLTLARLKQNYTTLKEFLFGTDTTNAQLPTPAKVIEIMTTPDGQ
jgi:hypothetical protein